MQINKTRFFILMLHECFFFNVFKRLKSSVKAKSCSLSLNFYTFLKSLYFFLNKTYKGQSIIYNYEYNLINILFKDSNLKKVRGNKWFLVKAQIKWYFSFLVFYFKIYFYFPRKQNSFMSDELSKQVKLWKNVSFFQVKNLFVKKKLYF